MLADRQRTGRLPPIAPGTGGSTMRRTLELRTERVLGQDHPDTLGSRNDLAYQAASGAE